MACGSRSEFDDKVLLDLENFVEKGLKKSVLVFPAVNSYCRFVIHQIIEGNFKEFFTFSIGQEPNRRIVVCPKNILASDHDSHSSGVKVEPTALPTDCHKTMVVGPDEPIAPTQPKKSRTLLPTAQIYRPPAARRSGKEANLPPPVTPSSEPPIKDTKPKARVRRPDLQVYVPRAKRISTENANRRGESQGTANYILPDGNDSGKGKLNKGRSQSPVAVRSRGSALVETKKKLCQSASSSDVEYEIDRIDSSEPAAMADVRRNPKLSTTANLPPRAEALVEMKKRLCQFDQEPDNLDTCHKSDVPSAQGRNANEPLVQGEVQIRPGGNNNVASDPLLLSGNVHCAVIGSQVTRNDEKCNTERIDEEVSKDSSQNNRVSSKVNISEVLANSDNSNLELPLYSSGYTSDSPPSSESGSSRSLSSMESCDVSNKTSNNKENLNKSKRSFNPDECDWDDLLDENGECLDPFLMKELTDAVGEVEVTRPQSDYNEYRSQAPADGRSYRRPDEDFGHVLEIYSFPPEFKTQDLMAVFLPFKNTGGGFEIKWVDDTHALGVFASSLVAAEVLQYRHPLVRTRPLSEGIQESRLKARRLSESIQSFRPRPATCAALARRLVTGALGVKLKTARQEREEEKKVLQEAREKRRLAAKQRDEIWND